MDGVESALRRIFMLWSYKMYEQWIKGQQYEIYRYFISPKLENKIKVLQKYFRALDKQNVPFVYKRRKNSLEYVDAAVMVLARIEQMIVADIPFVAGTSYLSSKPWAVFGEAPWIDAKLHFRDMDDIAKFYYDRIVGGNQTPKSFHFRCGKNIPKIFTKKYSTSENFIVCLAICLLHDIILYCGPDCPELFDLFDNDLRIKEVSLENWQNLRCNVMGIKGRIKKVPNNYIVGQIYEPHVELNSFIKFDLIESDDLESGEKFVELYSVDVPLEDDCDDCQSIELDIKYKNSVEHELEKHKHLGLML